MQSRIVVFPPPGRAEQHRKAGRSVKIDAEKKVFRELTTESNCRTEAVSGFRCCQSQSLKRSNASFVTSGSSAIPPRRGG